MHHPRHHFHALMRREVDEIYIHIAIKVFALSLVGIFIPIYLLQLTGLVGVLLFFAVLWVTIAVVFPVAGLLQEKIGSKHTILLSMPFFLLAYLMLYAFESLTMPTVLLGLAFGVANSLYWMPFHIEFAVASDKKNRTKQISSMGAIALLAASAAPLIGGIIASIDFPILFALTSVILMASAAPLFFTNEIRRKPKFKIRLFTKEIGPREGISFLAHGFQVGAAEVLWPIFMFTAIQAFVQFGALGSVTNLLTAIALVAAARIAKGKDSKLFRISTVADAITWPVRLLASTFGQLFVMAGIAGATLWVQNLPFNSSMYTAARRRPEYFWFREIWLSIGRLMLIAFVFLLIGTGFAIEAGIAITVIMPLLMLLTKRL